jgi:hypothetical protein
MAGTAIIWSLIMVVIGAFSYESYLNTGITAEYWFMPMLSVGLALILIDTILCLIKRIKSG